MQVTAQSRACFKGCTTSTGYLDLGIFGMNIELHQSLRSHLNFWFGWGADLDPARMRDAISNDSNSQADIAV